jgi:hypothetical protein
MYYKRQSYTLTDSDKVLIKSLAKLLFHGKDTKIELPFIVLDSSCKSPKQFKSPQAIENTSFDTELLGYYSPNIFTISLLEEPISDVARLLNVDKDILRSIVLIHEIGHYITQCPEYVLHPRWEEMIKSRERFWKDSEFMLEGVRRDNHVASAAIMTKSSRKLLETLAQLLTYFVVREVPEYEEVFNRMTAHQTRDYTEFRAYQNNDPCYLFRTMSLVRGIDYRNQTMDPTEQIYADDYHLKWLLKG